MGRKSNERGKTLFWIYSVCILLCGSYYIIQNNDSEFDILPIILGVKNHEEPLRVPGTFVENFSDSSSKAELVYLGDTAFQFKYTKSNKLSHTYAGVFFPLENVDIDFSKYDEIEVGITSDKSKRIPLNLSVQNKKYTHQYVRQFVDLEKGKTIYSLELDKFYTPTSWYKTNKISQVEIPDPDLSLVEAISMESCQLLDNGVKDQFTINRLVLTKDLFWENFAVGLIMLFLILICRVLYW